MRHQPEMIDAMLTEIALQQGYLENLPVASVYFGGGTPSVLETSAINQLLQRIEQFHDILPDAEITLEANPDDLTTAKLQQLSETKINRLSIGIQSFFDKDLEFMNRAHNSEEAIACIRNAQEVGFQNLTVDLIYGTPTMTNEEWRKNLQTVFDLNIPHVSCYCLTVEPKTALEHFVKTGKSKDVNEEQVAEQFQILVEEMTKHGYLHYEISNFAKPDFFAVHNGNYWKGKKYLGIGPSAHSFNGQSRQWNVANNAQYIKSLQENKLHYEVETLTTRDRYNEYIMTGLRTIWGVDLIKIEAFDIAVKTHFIDKSKQYLLQGLMIQEGNHYKLTSKGRLLSDGIISELFWI
jgi:oxygen-independent coproporphyrinogen-3 oxidase